MRDQANNFCTNFKDGALSSLYSIPSTSSIAVTGISYSQIGYKYFVEVYNIKKNQNGI
jgi:hypothetical protein